MTARGSMWSCILVAALIHPAFAESSSPAEPADLDAAWQAWERGDRSRAAVLVRDLVDDDVELVRSMRASILLARTAADAEEALERWEHVLALEPERAVAAEAHWSRGVAAAAAGQPAVAIEEFAHVERESRRTIDRGRALLARGLAELDAGEPGDALESLGIASRVAKNTDDRRAAELALASANFRLGRLQEALRRYDKFEREHSKDDRARWAAWRGVLCARLLGGESDAAERASRLEEKWPGSLEAVLAREEIRMGQKAPSKTPAQRPGSKDGANEDDATPDAGDGAGSASREGRVP